jgi:DNA-binding Xre family transcriptional regulator
VSFFVTDGVVLCTGVFLFRINDEVLPPGVLLGKIANITRKTTLGSSNLNTIAMLTFNFTRIFKARGIDKPFSYLTSLGYSANLATRIANNRIRRFDLHYVETFCEILQCTPNDLLQWFPSGKQKDNEKHPLFPLKRTDRVVHLTHMLSAIPLDKLSKIEDMIQKELEE